MTLDLDTFLVALYTIVDDLYQAQVAPQLLRGPGKRPALSDSEVLTLALCAQWLHRSERAVVRYALAHWRPYFPRLLSQSAYNRRSRRLAGVLVHLGPLVAQALGAMASAYQALDTVPVSLLRRCRGQYHRLLGDEAAIGTGGSDHDWSDGCQVLLAGTREGVITGFLLAPASTEDRWVADAFFGWRAWPLAAPCDPRALPPSASPRRWQQASWRQVVETVNDQLTAVFGLPFPRARSPWGLLTRVAAKVATLNLGVWLNRCFGRPDLALATLFTV